MKDGLFICTNGDKYWYKEGKLHREGGPAIEYNNGTKKWLVNGKFHREDGPAFESSNGEKRWYFNGEYIKCSSQEEFLRIIKLRALW